MKSAFLRNSSSTFGCSPRAIFRSLNLAPFFSSLFSFSLEAMDTLFPRERARDAISALLEHKKKIEKEKEEKGERSLWEEVDDLHLIVDFHSIPPTSRVKPRKMFDSFLLGFFVGLSLFFVAIYFNFIFFWQRQIWVYLFIFDVIVRCLQTLTCTHTPTQTFEHSFLRRKRRYLPHHQRPKEPLEAPPPCTRCPC